MIALLLAGLVGALVVNIAILVFKALINKIKTRLGKLKDGQTEVVAKREEIINIINAAMKEEGRTPKSIQEMETFQEQFKKKTQGANETVVMFDENGVEIIKADELDEATAAFLNENDNIIQISKEI